MMALPKKQPAWPGQNAPGRLARMSPAGLALAGFSLVILLGAVLLMLPVCGAHGPVSPLNALFTSVSAVCVTGLVVVDTGADFSPAGQAVILGLIQLGGLGIMTITVWLFALMGRRAPLKQRLAVMESFGQGHGLSIYPLVKALIAFTLLVELIGAALLFWHFSAGNPGPRALWLAVFHSISAFCNAGFALFPDSLMAWRGSPLVNFTVAGLIIAGGIGFPVVYELARRASGRAKGRLSLHSKLVLSTSGLLIVGGAVAIALLEWNRPGQNPATAEFWFSSLFQSVTARTAGFNTVDIGSLHTSTLTVLLFLMFFGASPGSCGGGLKTTTLATLVMFAVSRLRRGRNVNTFGHTIPNEIVSRAVSLFIFSVALLCLMLFLLLVTDEPAASNQGRPFLAHLFEAVSAFGTVGLSMGITPSLGAADKVTLMALMLIGRLGVPTFSFLLLGGGGENAAGLHYAEERFMLG